MCVTLGYYFLTIFSVFNSMGCKIFNEITITLWRGDAYFSESKQEARSIFVGVPTMDNVHNNPKNLMQLSGRLLLILMFVTLLKFNTNPLDLFRNFIGSVLMLAVAAGYKTKACSLLLCIWLMILNITMHNFWRHRSGSIMNDYKKFDFFQTLSVIGGLMMLVTLGPGGVSMDERKKMY